MRRPKPSLFLALSLIFSLLIIFLAPPARLIKPYLPFTNYLLGIDKPTSYLILLGNDAEMRANGGFAGSYAKLVISAPSSLRDSYSNQSNPSPLDRHATLAMTNPSLRDSYSNQSNPSPLDRHATLAITELNLSFQDIYVPNGQLSGYVTPPAPIQEAFQHGSWELANADWEPDFPTSAGSIRWFFAKGAESNPDNLLIINLTTIKKVLAVVGTFSVPEFSAQITPDNLYLFLQGKVEVGFFPGSTQKKDVLTAVGLALKQKILSLPLNKKIKIARTLYLDLKNQNIVVNSTNEAFQNLLIKENFAGKLSSTTPDTYLLVEVNLGANKANAYVQRQTTHTISPLQGLALQAIRHEVTVKLQNSSPESGQNPPFYYGGDYIAYLRFYIPLNAQNITTSRSLLEVTKSQKYGFTELGFWQTTPAQGQTSVSLSYTLPISPKNYSLTILKQHGLVSSPQTITIGTKTFSTPLENDFTFSPPQSLF